MDAQDIVGHVFGTTAYQRQAGTGAHTASSRLLQLLRILFEDGEWPDSCGLYLVGEQGSYFRARDVELVAHCRDGETLTGLTLAFLHVTFELVLRLPVPALHS